MGWDGLPGGGGGGLYPHAAVLKVWSGRVPLKGVFSQCGLAEDGNVDSLEK